MEIIERYPRWFLTLAALLYLLPGIAWMPLVDRDEPRFSRATVEMMERGDWVVPYFNNEYRFDKPPLTYWWMRLHYNIFGVTELGARLHSAISAWLISLLIFTLGRKSGLATRWALLAGIIWLSSLQVMIHGRIAVADMPLILGVTLAMLGFWKYLFAPEPPRRIGLAFACAYLGIAFGFLAKGPLAMLIPAISLLLLLAFTRGRGVAPGRWKKLGLDLIPGIVLVLAIIGAWGIPALIQTKGAYFDVGIGEHVVERGLTSFNKRTFIPGVYYFLIVLIFFSPWVSALWPSLKSHWRARKENPKGLFLLAWAASSFIIFSVYKTQLPHYILPAYPALALLAACFLSQCKPAKGFQLSLWVNRIALGAGAAAAFTLGIVTHGAEELRTLPNAFLALGLTLLFLLLASECVKRKKWRIAIGLTIACGLLFFPLTLGLRKAHITVALENNYGELFREADTAYSAGFGEPSLVWYSGRYWSFISTHDLPSLDLKDRDVLICNARRWRLDDNMLTAFLMGDAIEPVDDHRPEIEADFPGKTIRYVEGFSPGNSSWVEIAVISDLD